MNEVVGAITVYCLSCRGTWTSKTKYAAKLEHHTPRRRGSLADWEILELLLTGSIEVVPFTAQVFKDGKELVVSTKVHRDGPQRGTYRFVYICHDRRRKRIALHRLVWMAQHRRAVPTGYDVDHIFGHKHGDEIWNLRLMSSRENRQRGSDKRNGKAVPF